MKGGSFEIQSHLPGGWVTSALRFATEMEATLYVVDLMVCHPRPTETRIVPSAKAPTHVWLNHAGAVHLQVEVEL